MTQDTIGIIGAGAWGTALAQVYAGAGHKTMIWAREAEVTESINARHENTLFLPGVTLHKSLKASVRLQEVAAADVILIVTPTQHLRSALEGIRDALAAKPVILCCKGIEISSGKLPSEIAAEILPHPGRIAILTGPTFAAEIARGLPAAVTLAAADIEFARDIQKRLNTRNFRLYASGDMIGAQLGAALKNVIAIACGIVHGRGLGESARAAIISRGLMEIARLTAAMGGRAETLLGLCGLGDLTLTCSSMQSRNFSLGAAVGAGQSAAEVLASRREVTEGVHTARAAVSLAAGHKIDMPIATAVHACINEGAALEAVIADLLSRPPSEEIAL